jgi:hypothetical protein
MSGIAKHGVIRVNTLKVAHAKKHLAAMVASASEVRDYGGHSVTGEGSQSSFASGGAEGASYSTTNVGGTGDSDSTGSTGY